MALRPTTALREPENYGLRGWISTHSSDLAEALLKCVQGVLLKYSRAVCRGADRAAFPAIRRNALGIYQRSASGMKMSKGQIGRRLLGLAVAGVALATGGAA